VEAGKCAYTAMRACTSISNSVAGVAQRMWADDAETDTVALLILIPSSERSFRAQRAD
jgi:hypothetical protein